MVLHWCVLGPAHCPVHWAGLSGGLHGVLEGQWYRGSQHDERDGLPGGPQPAGDIWRGALPLLKQGDTKRGSTMGSILSNLMYYDT